VMVSAAGEIAALGRKALCVPAAVADRAASVSMATRVQDIFGRVDVLVHNTPLPPAERTRFEDADLDRWRASVDADVFGPLVLTQSVLPLLRTSTDARVIIIGHRPGGAIAPEGLGAYAAGQAALTSLTRTLARELAPSGIRVNVVQPGYPATPDGPDGPDAPAPVGPTDEEVAGAVVFLASPLSRAISGQAVHVDAGLWVS
jgi:3-oxoacyl-[acyl-carrier protein] reductase